MKTYKEVVEKPRLVIEYDQMPSNPRHDDNLGYFITKEGKHNSPDTDAELEAVMNESIDQIKRFKGVLDARGEKMLYICEVDKYEHGNVLYRRGETPKHTIPKDYSVVGYYIVTDKTQAVLGTPSELFEEVIDQELDQYTKWCNGDVWCFQLYDEDGVQMDGYGDIYDLADIESGLPKGFLDDGAKIEDYIQH